MNARDYLEDSNLGWLRTGYEACHPDPESVRRLAALLADSRIEALAFIGTWCPDCQEHFPAFLKILNQARFPEARLRIFNLGRDKKLPPWTEDHRIKKLPTFIFLRSGQEAGRVTETPESGDLLTDLLRILEKK